MMAPAAVTLPVPAPGPELLALRRLRVGLQALLARTDAELAAASEQLDHPAGP